MFAARRSSSVLKRFRSTESINWAKLLNKSLEETDNKLFKIIEEEKIRQTNCLNLIASENFTSKSVFDCLGSVMSNKYSEGYPNARYYGGNENIDKVELLCQERALQAFNLDPAKWGVNVQSLSGSPANMQAYAAVLNPHDRIMSLDLPHGGHLSHGYQTDAKKISAVSAVFETMPYRLDEATGQIDYARLEENAKLFRPKLVVAGASAYARLIDYKRMKEICELNNSYLLSDMAHISGLVSAGIIPSPFEFSDIVTTTTHKLLRGPRGAMIFFRKGLRSVNKKGEEVHYDLENKINFSVFPGHQGGPHNHTIAALATALNQCLTSEYKLYQTQVLKNSKHFSLELIKRGYNLVGGGTDNHLVLINLNKSKNHVKSMDGGKVQYVMELANLTANKNTVPGDVSAMSPGGIRMGTPALTTRGFTEEDFTKVAEYFDRCVNITANAIKIANEEIKKSSTPNAAPKLKDFKSALAKIPELNELAEEIKLFAQSFPTIGYE